MTHHFVSANLWFAVGLLLLIGNGPSHSSSRLEAFYGYGKFDMVPAFCGIVAPFAVCFWNLRRWLAVDRMKAHPAVFYTGANAWFILGLVLLLGLGQHPSSSQHLAVFGYGRLFFGTAYLGVAIVFAAAVWNFRHWRRVNQPAGVAAEPPAARPVAAGGIAWSAVAFAGVIGVTLLLVGLAVVRTGEQQYVTPTAVVREGPAVVQAPLKTPAPDVGYAVNRTFVAVPVVMFAIFFATAFFVIRRLRQVEAVRRAFTPQTDEDKKRLPPDQVMGDDGWMPVQKRRVAAVAPVVCTVGVVALTQLVLRDLRADLYNRGLALILGVAAAAVWVCLRLHRWAYAEPAARPSVISPPRPPAPSPPPAARNCPQCHTPLAADAPQGLCPRCLLAGAFGSILNPSRTGPYAGTVEPPGAEEVQEHFPHLEVIGLIGQGGMGAVYQARQPNLDRTVALKLIRPREDNPMFAERFVREAKAMAKLSHPNIVHVHESGEAGGSLYLVMEYVDGVTLREAIRAKAIPAAEALKIVGQLCDALEYAHAQGVVHRDIKPENILLDRTGRVKVVDFGLAKLANDNAVSLTHTRQAMGTPHYMAPEQWEKPTEVDHRADIYALGVVIYELLTGELPLGRFDPPSVKAHLDARIDEIVLRLLAKEPDRRYQRASDVRTALFNIGAAAFPAPRASHGRGFYEYRSEAAFWGWPLVHVVGGIDPRTGTKRVAKGWLAVGDVMAIGAVAISGVCSLGLVSVAGVIGLGGLALAGALSAGGLSVGGTAVGYFALGGVALGWLAVGGVAVGKFALGGAAVGDHVHKKGADPEFWKELREDLAETFDW